MDGEEQFVFGKVSVFQERLYCGFFVRERDDVGDIKRIGHTGSSGTNCWIDYEHNCIGIMLTQTRGKDIKAFRIELEKRLMQCIARGR